MTEADGKGAPSPAKDYGEELARMREEFAQQFKELKDAFEAERKEKEEEIATLKEQNVGLQRALVRSAVTDPPKEEPAPKTEEDLYREELARVSQRTIDIMKEM